MYLGHTTRRKDGKVYRYWQLVRCLRVGRKVVQQTVAHLGAEKAKVEIQVDFMDTPNLGVARHRYPFVAPAVRPAM